MCLFAVDKCLPFIYLSPVNANTKGTCHSVYIKQAVIKYVLVLELLTY